MDIGTGSEEEVRIIVGGNVRLVFKPDGSVHWFCAHAHCPDDPDGAHESARICTKGCWHGKLVGTLEGSAVLSALRLDMPTQLTIGPKGDAAVMPNKPAGYITINVGEDEYVMPFFKKA